MHVRKLVAVVGFVGLSTALIGVTPAGAGPSGGEETFCDGVADLSLLFNRVDDRPTAKQQRNIDRLLGEIEESAPAELAGQVQTAVAGIREGNFDDPAVSAAIAVVDGWVADNCGYEVVDVTAREYVFEGVPETLDKGLTIFRFTNEGAELHEMALFRIKGDESIHELLELDDDEVEGKVQEVGGAFAAQGETGFAYVKLTKAGRYGAVCFIPVGSTSEQAAETADGPPHAMEGMTAEFTVNK